jgi:hypothetical protein
MFSNLAQIFHHGTLYFRVQMEEGSRLISSKKENLELKHLKERGVSFPTLAQNAEAPSLSFLKNKTWSLSSIKKFLDSSGPIVDPKQLFLRVKNLITKFPHPGDEKELSVLTLLPFLSGLYSVFRTIPYFLLVGDPYLKQLFLDIFEKICFNSIRLNSPNTSLISRLIHLYGCTLLLTIPHDNPGRYPFNNMLSILEEGCRRSGSFYVLNERGIPLSLPVHSLKILDAEIRGQYLKHLPVEIRIEKPSDTLLHLRTSEIEELQGLRDDVHIFCLENVTSISNIYDGMETIPGIPSQHMESLFGIFSIAKHLDTFFETPFLFDAVVTWAKDMALRLRRNQKFQDKHTHIIYLVAEFIHRFNPRPDGFYVAEDVSKYVHDAGDFRKDLRPEDVTRVIGRFILDHDRPRMERDGAEKQRTTIKINEKKIMEYLDG